MHLDAFLKSAGSIIKESNILTAEEELHHYSRDRSGFSSGKAPAVLFPENTGEVREIVKLASTYRVPLVPSGGRTGYAGGASVTGREVVVSLSRMSRVLDFDPYFPSLTCEAGTVTKILQEEALKHGFYFPVDFASSGSSTIGGNVATNAGGIHVIRYGNIRNWVLGLEVVTGTGDVLSFPALLKNNTGYDFKHLFIGSEGTLGIITKVSLLLTVPPEDSAVILAGIQEFPQVLRFLKIAKQMLKGLLAFEVFDSHCMDLVVAKYGYPYPFSGKPRDYHWYVLIETEVRDERNLSGDFFHEVSALDSFGITLSDSPGRKKQLYRYRENISEAISLSGKFHKNDISLPVPKVETFLEKVKKYIDTHLKDYRFFLFGHLGDGNLHLNLLTLPDKKEEEFRKDMQKFDEFSYNLIRELSGSISAEHGIGILKKPYLLYSRTQQELDLMKQVKKLLDPANILNPGKIFDM